MHIVSKKRQAEAAFLLLAKAAKFSMTSYCVKVCAHTTKLRHIVLYWFLIFFGEVITPNLGNHKVNMMISLAAIKQSNLLIYFQEIIMYVDC